MCFLFISCQVEGFTLLSYTFLIKISFTTTSNTILHPKCYICGNVRYNTHLYCLAVQAGFYSDAVECLTATQEILVRSSAGTKGV